MRLYHVLYTRNYPIKIGNNNKIHYLQSFFLLKDSYKTFASLKSVRLT